MRGDEAKLIRLERALGRDIVSVDVPEPYWNDWAGLSPVVPRALVRPRTPQEVAETLRICNELALGVTPQGGRTGLAAGARPSPGSVVLSLERLAGVEEVDAAAAVMRVRAGTVLAHAQQAALEAGLLLPLDLGARGSCQIGGNLATNAGGNKVIRFGMAREMVLGLEVALADGTLLSNLTTFLKNNAGFDLKQLFIGSEGTLGIITRASLRLQPAPSTRSAAFLAVSGFDAVLEVLRRARRHLAGLLSAFEVMWPEFYELFTGELPHLRRPLRPGLGLYLLVEAQGFEAEADEARLLDLLERLHREGLVVDGAVATSEREVEEFWAVRDAVAEIPRLFGRHLNFDLGLDLRRMHTFAADCRRELGARFPSLRAIVFGHIGDGNLHLVTDLPGGIEPQAVEEIVYATVRAHGGSISAEHGIGTIKKPYLGLVRSPEEIAAMRRLKQALDPRGILNPGKVLDP